MTLDLLRYSDNGNSTLGLLFVNGVFECYTLEDEYREEKIYGETRIAEGSYTIAFRTHGVHHAKYKNKFGFHIGMLELLDVPNFTDILIHIGNTDKDTAGCIIVVDDINNNRQSEAFGRNSTQAYEHMYRKVSAALRDNVDVKINIKTIEV